jgi:predicted dehydrogenase
MNDPTRRDVLKMAAATGVVLTTPGALAAAATAAATQPTDGAKALRVGFIGVGDRGTALLRIMLKFPAVRVTAVCDIDGPNLVRGLDVVEKVHGHRPEGYGNGPHDYRRLLARDDVDAVVIGTPQEGHAEQCIDAMKAGKFVGVEVPACVSIDECHALVRTRRETKAGYMMLENYLYGQPVMMVQRMVDRGVFGDLTYGFGAYIHEIRGMRFNKDGSLTWRGRNVLKNRGVVYPTHAIGPVCRWMGVNDGDRLETLVAMDSKPAGTRAFAVEKFGPDSAAAKVEFENGDTNHALIRTAKGRLIEVRYDTSSPRPSGMGQYSLQGTKASYESAFGVRNVYIEGRSPEHKWEPLEKYEPEYQHPYWARHAGAAGATGHGGGDWFVIADFLRAARTGQSPIDVVDAVTWSAVRPLSEQSIRAGSQPVPFPKFGDA